MSNFNDPTQEELRMLGEEFKNKFSLPSFFQNTLSNHNLKAQKINNDVS